MTRARRRDARRRRARRRGRAARRAPRARRRRRRRPRDDAFFALRAALCSTPRGAGAVRRGVRHRVRGAEATVENPLRRARRDRAGRAAAGRHAADRPGRGPDETTSRCPAAYSDEELLREKDFASYTRRRARARPAPAGPDRRPRAAAAQPPHAPDARAAARPTTCARPCAPRCATAASWSSAATASPACAPRRVVLVCDVSGSMAPYARMLLQYLQASVAARARVEAFVFGTRLTRVTRDLEGRDPDRALARAAERVTDWSGGTRIGAALAELNREHGRRIGRGAVVVILSDGWDRGDPELLGRRDGAPAPHRAPAAVAEPARRRPALRAAHPRHARRAAARGPPAARATRSPRWNRSQT